MDMFSGNAPMAFTPRDYAGNQIGIGDAIAQNSNSLVGLGMGLLSPYRPGESPYAAALQGYQAGSVADSNRGYRTAQLQHQKTQEARQAANDAFQRQQAALDRDLKERQFARGDVTDAQRAMKDVLGSDATPEQKAAFMKQYYTPKTEGDWQIVQVPHPTYPGETVPAWANKRTRETQPFTGQPAPDAATAADPFTAGVGRSVYGTGGDYSTPAPTTGGAAPAPSTGGIPPAPPGSDPKEWRKEQTKLRVQQQTAEEARKRNAGMIDPVTEDIDRAINQTKQYPGMIAGTFGNLMKNIPGSQAADVGKLVDTIKANASLDKLSQMRAQSPTGASGLGAVTQGEHKLLQDSIGALDQSQTPEQFLYNLDRVKRIRHEIIHGPGTAPPPQFELPEGQRPKGAAAGGGTSAGGPVRWGRDAAGNPVRLP
jgi:hypothetical protein